MCRVQLYAYAEVTAFRETLNVGPSKTWVTNNKMLAKLKQWK